MDEEVLLDADQYICSHIVLVITDQGGDQNHGSLLNSKTKPIL